MMFSLFILVLVLVVIVLLYFFRRDRKYLKKPTREVLSPDLKKEIEAERNDFDRRKSRFEKALTKAQTRSRTPLTRKS